MLRALGVSTLALLSNNPDKAAQLERLGLTVAARVATGVHRSEANARYLSAKARNGHQGLEPRNGVATYVADARSHSSSRR
jgi:GTP cyclohydrolase II